MLRMQRHCTLQFKRYFSLDGRNRLSNKFMPVTKDRASNSAESSSHQILLQAGFVRQSGAGIYSLLPLGLRIVDKIERIIDVEMQAIGSEKLSLPMLLNPDAWKKTGRWDGSKGEFFRLQDRKESDLLLAPTHEEEITQLVASQLQSPKQLPIRLYQIGRKYRDELRPRAGLLRGREFIMKDLYSFDATQEDAFVTYDQVAQAYRRIFDKMGVPFVVAEADSGNIGGSKSHEYHLISPVGEDTLLTCSGCGYTANEELAVGKVDQLCKDSHTALTDSLLLCNVDSTVVAFKAAAQDGVVEGLAAIFTPPQREANILKVQTLLSKYLKRHKLMSETATMDMEIVPFAKAKSIDPATVRHLHVFVDDAVELSLQASEQLTIHPQDHFRIATEGDHCVSCAKKGSSSSRLSSVKAIECGHTFYLGTKYSSVLDCGFRESGRKGNKVPTEMGCYGIGITRLLAAVAEARHDTKGIAWPAQLAPYSVCIVPTDDRKQAFKDIAGQIYDRLAKGHLKGDVVIDDRRLGFGAKMKDAELVGYPYTIIVGPNSLQQEQPLLEIHQRIQYQDSKKTNIELKDLLQQHEVFITI